MYKLLWSKSALKSIVEISCKIRYKIKTKAEYYLTHRPSASGQLLTDIYSVYDEDLPDIYEGFRIFKCCNYRLIYKVVENNVLILVVRTKHPPYKQWNKRR